MPWSDLTSWWLDELADDAAYESVVTPLLLDVLDPQPGGTYVDLGSGEGRVARAVDALGAVCFGVELNEDLARKSGMRSAVARLPSVPIRTDSVDGVFTVLVLEHIADHQLFFFEAARIARPGGILIVVCNHPTWTAPGSTPITDTDGEVLWRPGKYFSGGSSEIPAGESSVTFHHRSMSDLLNAASAAGWSLERMIEKPHHELKDQPGIPRLLACRWRRWGRELNPPAE